MENDKILILENDKVKCENLVNILKDADVDASYLISDINFSPFIYEISLLTTETSPRFGLIVESCFLKMVYTWLAAYPNEIKTKWFQKDHGFKKKELRWFISIDELLKKVDELNSMNNAFLLPSDVVEMVYSKYLPRKIWSEVSWKFKFIKEYDGEMKSIISIQFFKFLQNVKNRKKKGSNIVKTKEDEMYNCLVNSTEIDAGDQARGLTPEQVVKKHASGDVDDLLIAPLYHKYRESDNELSEAVKLKAIFDLFLFIMKDRKWQSEDEFEKRRLKPYDGDYDVYKTATVRKFIYKK